MIQVVRDDIQDRTLVKIVVTVDRIVAIGLTGSNGTFSFLCSLEDMLNLLIKTQ